MLHTLLTFLRNTRGATAIVPALFGWPPPSFAFDILVQLGTLGAVCVYLRDDLRKICVAFVKGLIARRPFDDPDAKKGWLLLLSTVPAVVIGLLIKDWVAEAFTNPSQVLYELFGTGVLLLVAEWLAQYLVMNRSTHSLPIRGRVPTW